VRPARYAVGVRSASGIFMASILGDHPFGVGASAVKNSSWEFFRQDILVLSENSHIHVRRPTDFSRCLHRYGFMGPQKRKNNSNSQ